MAQGDGNNQVAQMGRRLGNYFKPGIQLTNNGVLRLPTNNQPFELKLGLINMVQNSLFHGMIHEDPIDHVEMFFEKCDTVHINNVPNEIIHMRLFLFSLVGRRRHGFMA